MKLVIAALLAAVASPALAQDLREFCGDRPGLGTPACTVDPGHLQIEAGLGDWTLDKQPDSRSDTILAGDVSLRYGIGDTTELRLGWTAYGHIRERDRASGALEQTSGIGDVTVGLKQNVMNPAGDALSIALLPFATLPTGKREIGRGTWSAGLVVPIDYELSKGIDLQLTPEIDAAADEDGDGRHLAYGTVVGIDFDLAEKIALDAEVQITRDRDPSGRTTMALGGLALDYMVQEQTQLDIGAVAGLNHNSPDIELYFGVSRKF